MSLEQAVEGWKYTAHYDDAPALLEPWLRSLVTGEIYEVEVRRRDRTGEYHWYRTRAVPVFKDGKIIKWCGENQRNSFSKWENPASWEGEYFQGGLPDGLGFCFIRLGKGAGDREPVFTVIRAGNNHEDVCLDRASARPTDQALSGSRRQMPNVIVCRRR